MYIYIVHLLLCIDYRFTVNLYRVIMLYIYINKDYMYTETDYDKIYRTKC